jgi:cytidyltransferase-like protein
MKHIQLFEQFIAEANATGEKVVLFPGRFQPMHLGHIKAFERAYKVFGVKVIPIQIISKNEDSPFPRPLLEKIADSVTKEYSFIAKVVVFPEGIKTVIPQMVKLIREMGYDPIGLACGDDRFKDYQRQVNYLLSDKSDVPTSEFRLEVVDERIPNGPSGTKTREALKTDDRKAFDEMVPKSVRGYFDELKKYLQ